jgi:hypothetical protein
VQQPVVVGPPLAIDVSNPQGIVLKRALKGSPDKKTCFVEFAGRTLVVKGGSGDSADHVAAGELIGKLGLRGVRVPACRLLDGAEKAAIVQAFGNGDMHARELANSLSMVNPDGSTSGQLAELSPGVTPQKLHLSKEERNLADDAISRRQAMVDKAVDKETAWDETYKELITRAHGSMIKTEIIDRAGAKAGAERAVLLQHLKDNCIKESQLMMVALLKEIEDGTVAQGLNQLKADQRTQNDQRAALKAFAESQAGIEAFAGIAAADLVTGMDDRIMGKFNGGNFLFDEATNELVCIDNSKNFNTSLSAKDPAKWKNFVNGPLAQQATLEDAIYHRIYGKGKGSSESTESAPSNYVGFCSDKNANGQDKTDAEKAADATTIAAAKDTIRQTLARVVNSVEGDPTQSKPARDRAAFLKARMAIDDYFRVPFDLADPPALPVKIDTSDKLLRAGKSFFTSNKKDKRTDTQAIKDDLRAGRITAAVALQKLKALETTNPGLPNDRRATKIKYLAAVTAHAENLGAIGKGLDDILQTAPAGVLSDAAAKLLGTPLRDSMAQWKVALANDRKTLALVEKAWNALPASLTSA